VLVFKSFILLLYSPLNVVKPFGFYTLEDMSFELSDLEMIDNMRLIIRLEEGLVI